MFTGIIEDLSILIFIKNFKKNLNFYSFFFIKIINYNYYNINIGNSFLLNGICFTLINKNLNFLEFEASKETLFNIYKLNYLKKINIEKSFKILSKIDGHLLLGHVNNIIVLIKIISYIKFLKLCFIIFSYLKKYIIYKTSFTLNGISFTVNNFKLFNNKYIVCLNIIFFTYNFSNIYKNMIFDLFNLELDFSIYYILNFLCF